MFGLFCILKESEYESERTDGYYDIDAVIQIRAAEIKVRINKGERMKIRQKGFTCQRDDFVIRGNVYRARKGRPPVAVISHGFMASQISVQHYARFLALEGYAAFCFDFNGGSVLGNRSSGRTEE